MGATGMETDARVTADGQIVLTHDDTLGAGRALRMLRLGGRRVSSLRRDEIPDEVPTLGDYYAHLGAGLPLSVDVKDPAAFDPLVRVARSHDATAQLWLCHDDLDLLASWRAVVPEAKLVHSTRPERLTGGHEPHAARLARLGIDAINFRHDAWSGGLVTLYHRFGVLALGWDAQHTHQIAELVDAGIDGFYSDHVDRIAMVLAAMSGQDNPRA